MKSRVERIFRGVPREIDTVLLVNSNAQHVDMAFFHATDLVEGGGFERSVAAIHRDGRTEILVPMLEETSAKRAKDATLSTFSKNDERKAWIQERLQGQSKVGIHAAELVASDFLLLREVAGKAELVDVTKALDDARAVKDRVELARIEKACAIASEVADLIPTLLKDGMKEFELAAEISYHMQKRGATGPSFDTIVGFGEGSAEPHYAPHDVPLKKGEFALCDFGAWYQRYASDITRTWIRGPATKEQKAVYDKVLEAEEAALAAVKPGAKGGDVHLAAEKVIDASTWKGRFIHSVGHSLGLAVHDGPALHPRNPDFVLEEGMVVTIEPGIYVPGFGGVRIEDDVVVTKNGYRMLTKAKRDAPVV
jgi:Xaa-Pro dipeptidase